MKNNNLKKNDSESNNENLSFFEKVRTDKKYSAKVQLIGYGALILLLIVYTNIASLGNSVPTNTIVNEEESDYLIDNENDDSNLLERINDNYQFDIVVEYGVKNDNIDESDNFSKIRYIGKSYDNKLEITREDINGNSMYYKVDDRYYLMENDEMSLIEDDSIFNIIDAEYVEIDSILNLISDADLDYVTDYSSGKKEYLYHLKVSDIIVSYKLDDVIEFKIEEENEELKIKVDYSNLVKVLEKNVEICNLEVTISSIGAVEKFLILDDEDVSN